MLHGKVVRLRKRFPERVFADISACLQKNQAVGATILLCCAIDCLARYCSGEPSHQLNKNKYQNFLKDYFEPAYHPESFYTFVRCGLVHGYNMEGKYIILGSRDVRARALHMKFSSNHRATIINPFTLYEDVRRAFYKFIEDLENQRELRRRFLRVWKSSPFEKQQFASVKFKYLLEEAQRP